MKLNSKIITIDGPSASGKGVLSKKLSKHLNFEILDSGLLYRAYAYLFNLNNDHDQTKSDLKKINFINDSTKIKVFFENREISNDLRSEDCAKKASELSALKITRDNLILLQRSFINDKGLIADGRDMGTIVFPEAKFKFFITANQDIRTERRYKELQNRGQKVNMRDLKMDIINRDKLDRERILSPLLPAEDSIIIDTSSLLPEEVFNSALSSMEIKK
ncbi:MAG: (d)CMP kinase [Pseudomonadota bacterium]|nr:(d)CMP kinase [Pseudomonadota bacterium]